MNPFDWNFFARENAAETPGRVSHVCLSVSSNGGSLFVVLAVMRYLLYQSSEATLGMEIRIPACKSSGSRRITPKLLEAPVMLMESLWL